MKYLKIQNNGELDIRLVALMGGTTKANDKYKIGQFGTGLKYTLAYLFRNNIDFKIFCGASEVNIATISEVISDTQFEIICINENRTSITTGMGREWNAWMIVRELWCNALDEGNAEKVIVSEKDLSGNEGKTTFYIQLTPDFQEAIDNWRKYFVESDDAIWQNNEFAIYHNDRKENLCLYKNGVLIYQHPNTSSLFCYDIKGAEINELREFKGVLSYSILKALERPSNDVISYFLKHIKEEHYEGCELDYDWFVQFADVWRDAIGHNRIVGTGSFSEYEVRGVDVDYSNVIELPKKVYKALTKQFEGVGALAMSDDNTEFYEVPFPQLTDKVKFCIEMLSSCNFEIPSHVSIKYGFFKSKTQLVSSNKHKNTILISDACIAVDNENLCSFIVEETEYLKTGIDKKTSKYSNHFISLYTKLLLNTK